MRPDATLSELVGVKAGETCTHTSLSTNLTSEPLGSANLPGILCPAELVPRQLNYQSQYGSLLQQITFCHFPAHPSNYAVRPGKSPRSPPMRLANTRLSLGSAMWHKKRTLRSDVFLVLFKFLVFELKRKSKTLGVL